MGFLFWKLHTYDGPRNKPSSSQTLPRQSSVCPEEDIPTLNKKKNLARKAAEKIFNSSWIAANHWSNSG